jgi:hypothetical protein
MVDFYIRKSGYRRVHPTVVYVTAIMMALPKLQQASEMVFS